MTATRRRHIPSVLTTVSFVDSNDVVLVRIRFVSSFVSVSLLACSLYPSLCRILDLGIRPSVFAFAPEPVAATAPLFSFATSFPSPALSRFISFFRFKLLVSSSASFSAHSVRFILRRLTLFMSHSPCPIFPRPAGSFLVHSFSIASSLSNEIRRGSGNGRNDGGCFSVSCWLLLLLLAVSFSWLVPGLPLCPFPTFSYTCVYPRLMSAGRNSDVAVAALLGNPTSRLVGTREFRCRFAWRSRRPSASLHRCRQHHDRCCCCHLQHKRQISLCHRHIDTSSPQTAIDAASITAVDSKTLPMAPTHALPECIQWWK